MISSLYVAILMFIKNVCKCQGKETFGKHKLQTIRLPFSKHLHYPLRLFLINSFIKSFTMSQPDQQHPFILDSHVKNQLNFAQSTYVRPKSGTSLVVTYCQNFILSYLMLMIYLFNKLCYKLIYIFFSKFLAINSLRQCRNTVC